MSLGRLWPETAHSGVGGAAHLGWGAEPSQTDGRPGFSVARRSGYEN